MSIYYLPKRIKEGVMPEYDEGHFKGYQREIIEEATEVLGRILEKLTKTDPPHDCVEIKTDEWMEAVSILGARIEYARGLERIIKGLVLKLGGEAVLSPEVGKEMNSYQLEQQFTDVLVEGEEEPGQTVRLVLKARKKKGKRHV